MDGIKTDILVVARLANSTLGMDYVHLAGVEPQKYQSSDLR